jgi:hypothetical protein
MRDVPDIRRGRRIINRNERVDTVIRIQPTCGRTSSAKDGRYCVVERSWSKTKKQKGGGKVVPVLN